MSRLAVLIVLVLPSAATAGAPPSDEAKRICRPAAPTVGSHIKRSKVCRAAAEWEEIDAARRGPDVTVKPRQPESWELARPQ